MAALTIELSALIAVYRLTPMYGGDIRVKTSPPYSGMAFEHGRRVIHRYALIGLVGLLVIRTIALVRGVDPGLLELLAHALAAPLAYAAFLAVQLEVVYRMSKFAAWLVEPQAVSLLTLPLTCLGGSHLVAALAGIRGGREPVAEASPELR